MKLKAIVGVALDRIQQSNAANSNATKAISYITRDGSNVEDGDNTQGVVNDTDSELSALSHVDAPNDVFYMVCGVVIAMLLVGLIIVLVAVTISKLRKREETSSASPVTIEAQHTFGGAAVINSNCNNLPVQQILTTSISDSNNVAAVNCFNNNNNNHNGICNGTLSQTQSQPQIGYRTSGGGNEIMTNAWVFPPKAPTPNIYNCNNNFDALIAANEKHGFKGFRKQFSGRFKRLVAKKPQEPAPAIPPELKPQLKTIYVY